MRFLIDAQLPPALAARLQREGHEAFHVTDHLPGYAADLEIAHLATRMDAALISKDEDFVALSARGILDAPLLWIRSGNMTTARLWDQLQPALPTILAAFESGERIVELR